MGVNGPPPESRARECPGEVVPRQQRSAPLARALLAPTAAPQAAAREQTNKDREADRGAKTHTHRDREYTLQRASGRYPDNVDRAHTMARDKTRPFSLSLSCYIWKTDLLLGFRNLYAHTPTESSTPLRTQMKLQRCVQHSDTLSQRASVIQLTPALPL